MVSRQVDVLVIGAGAAGAVAAARARARGLSTLQVAKSVGATGYSSGAVLRVPEAELAFELFKTLTHEIGLVENAFSVTQVGLVKAGLLVQKSQACDLSKMTREDRLGVVEFSGLSCFRAAPVAKMLTSEGYRAHAVSVDLMPSCRTFLEFAKHFDEVHFQEACFQALAQLRASCKHFFLPAILGLKSPVPFLERLKHEAGVSASELLGLSHSIPGWRLSQVLNRGVQVAKVSGFERVRHQVTEVMLESGEKISPKRVILATGRFLAGGFAGEREALFGLPVFGEELFKKGLRVDAQQRPLDAFGEIFATNLFAAGACIGGFDPAHEGGIGQAIATGYRAGDLC